MSGRAWTAGHDDRARVQVRRVRCDVCVDGWCDGDYIAPDVCRSVRCTDCDGAGWIDVKFETITEHDLDEVEANQGDKDHDGGISSERCD